MTATRMVRFLLNYAQLTFGAFITAVSVIIFLAPFNIAPTGASGIAVILNHLFDMPIGIVVLLLNVPIQIMAYYMLPGGWRTVMRTVYLLLVFSFGVDVLIPVLPQGGISDDMLLNALFGGVVGGIGHAVVLRAGGTLGGTSTVAQIIQQRTGMPLSSIYLYTDTFVIGIAGVVFGWPAALYAIVALFVDGLAANYVIEGPSVIRTTLIITDLPDDVANAIMSKLHRGATGWSAQGMFTKQSRNIVYVTIGRSQVQELRRVVHQADPDAFMVIGHGHSAYGEGFRRVPVKTE